MWNEMDSPLTVLLMASPHVKMEILPPRMIGCIRVGELGKKWTWVFRQRVEFQLVYDIADGLITPEGQKSEAIRNQMHLCQAMGTYEPEPKDKKQHRCRPSYRGHQSHDYVSMNCE
jgi:hypothetical protein